MRKTKRQMQRIGESLEVLDLKISYSAFFATFNSEKAHNYISSIMIFFTMLSIIMIVENQAYIFQFPKIFGIDFGYGLAIIFSAIVGYFFSDFSEEGKISHIRNFIFSRGWNRGVSFTQSLGFILMLIIINVYGVLAMADFYYRFKNTNMLNSAEMKLDFEGIESLRENSALIKRSDFTLEKEAIRQLQAHRNTIVANPNSYTKRNLAVQDWKIKEAIKDLSQKQMQQNQMIASITTTKMEKIEQVKSKITAGKAKNLQEVEETKFYAFWVAIGGEIIDAFFILGYLLAHRTNPSLQAKPSIIKGKREELLQVDFLEINSFSKKHKLPNKKKESGKCSNTKPKPKKVLTEEQNSISDKELYALNLELGHEIGNFVGGFLKQPSQTRFVKWLKDVKNISVHTTRLSSYNANYQENGKLQALKNNQGYVMLEVEQEKVA